MKIVMARELSEIGLTDQSSAALLKEEVVFPLLEMISNVHLKAKLAAI